MYRIHYVSMRILWLIMCSIVAVSCARSPIKSTSQAMRPATMPELQDDLEFHSLVAGLEANIKFLRERPSGGVLGFGPRAIPREEYLVALEYLLTEAKADPSGERFRHVLKERFEAFEVYGQDNWGEVFMTSYFEPMIEGSLKPTKDHFQPLYARPKDLVDVDLDSFIPTRQALSFLEKAPLEQRSKSNTLRGRLIPPKDKESGPRVVVYPSRADIDSGEIKEQAQVLAYVSPIDAFVLEIQGSGVVKLPNGKEIKVGYAAQNGHPYVPIGKHMFDVIPKEKMSLFTIESHLKSLPTEEARKLMQLNPSYVFFRPLTSARGITFMGTEVVDGRTIASDQMYFPKGVLAHLQFEKPQFASEKDIEPQAWTPAGRFVLDQDTGGAIRGPGRIDLFAGRGSIAKQMAAVMRRKARLVYFVPKVELVQAR